MDLQLHSDYVYTRQLSLNVGELKQSCKLMEDFIKNTFDRKDGTFYKTSSLTTNVYNKYNLLMYPIPGIHKLHSSIKETFHAANAHRHGGTEPHDDYFIQCWLNVYEAGDFIDWHSHVGPEIESWHGFYCLDVENSSTFYKLPTEEIVEIVGEENLLVMAKSDGDIHRSSEWLDKDRPRITIAFDIVPSKHLFSVGDYKNVNHWVPI